METSVLLKRFGFYLIGFSVGLVFLAFFIKQSGSKIEFCYGVDCRVLKNIRSKHIVYSDEVDKIMSEKLLDSVAINTILNDGDVIISKSKTKLDSCKVYYIEGTVKDEAVFLRVENCNKTATVKTLEYE